jgi:hypothetical protein
MVKLSARARLYSLVAGITFLAYGVGMFALHMRSTSRFVAPPRQTFVQTPPPPKKPKSLPHHPSAVAAAHDAAPSRPASAQSYTPPVVAQPQQAPPVVPPPSVAVSQPVPIPTQSGGTPVSGGAFASGRGGMPAQPVQAFVFTGQPTRQGAGASPPYPGQVMRQPPPPPSGQQRGAPPPSQNRSQRPVQNGRRR